MRRWIALFELGFAVLFLACAVVSWQAARRTTEFVGTDEHPGFVAVRYVPPRSEERRVGKECRL